jgi:hypothetical protein
MASFFGMVSPADASSVVLLADGLSISHIELDELDELDDLFCVNNNRERIHLSEVKEMKLLEPIEELSKVRVLSSPRTLCRRI